MKWLERPNGSQRIMGKKTVRKYDLLKKIEQLERKVANAGGELSYNMRNIFEELVEKMDAEIGRPQPWENRDWWVKNVKNQSFTLHLLLKERMIKETEWRFRTPPLFLSDEEMESRYGPR